MRRYSREVGWLEKKCAAGEGEKGRKKGGILRTKRDASRVVGRNQSYVRMGSKIRHRNGN